MALTWERGFFDEAMASVLFDEESWAEAPKEVSGLLRLTGLRRGSVLDASCGVGRHCLAFAKRGLDVTGVDFNAAYLAQAKKRAKREGLQARFEVAQLDDLRHYRGRFGLVTNLFTSFGYYPTAAGNLKALRQMAACLKPGGWLAVELLPRESLRRLYEPQTIRSVPGGWLIEERRWRAGGKRLATRAIWEKKGKRRVQDSEFQTFSRADLLALFRKVGCKAPRAFGGFSGRPFKIGDRLLVLGQKT